MKEKTFVSLVACIPSEQKNIGTLLTEIHQALSASFETYEVILVNNATDSNTTDEIDRIAKNYTQKTVSLQLPWKQASELAIFAGLEFSMGDFVFDVEHMEPGFPKNIFIDLFKKSGEGYDIVNIVPTSDGPFATSLFYRIFEKVSHLNLRLETHSIRLVTRRALNALFKIKQRVRYRKAQYVYTGFKSINLPYPVVPSQEASFIQKLNLAFDLIISFSDIGLKITLLLSFLFFAFSVLGGIFAIAMYFIKSRPAEGWTTLMLFSSFGFSGTFLILSILLKYVITLLREVQQNPLYVLSGIHIQSKDKE